MKGRGLQQQGRNALRVNHAQSLPTSRQSKVPPKYINGPVASSVPACLTHCAACATDTLGIHQPSSSRIAFRAPGSDRSTPHKGSYPPSLPGRSQGSRQKYGNLSKVNCQLCNRVVHDQIACTLQHPSL